MLTQQVKDDLGYLLDAAKGAATPFDELTLLRASLRKYMEGSPATSAAAWAAKELSNSITQKFT